MTDINLSDYDYDLPVDRIAQYPVNERDMSNLLVVSGEKIYKEIFRNIDRIIPSDSLLVFNNTRVIRARIIFQKETGADIEVLCLEPLAPAEYESSFSSFEPVEWKCIVGNLKKWKRGKILTSFIYNNTQYTLSAEKVKPEGEAWRIRFNWNCPGISFSDVLEITGHVPLPPYISRDDEPGDVNRYQTVYSAIKGSVAAPTAGLHFTERVMEKLREKGIRFCEITLHVGAGTFQPVKSKKISGHEMHCEHLFVSADTIKLILDNPGKIIAVGTTSVRTLESLYWLGVKILNNNADSETGFHIGQWEAYTKVINVTVRESLEALLSRLSDKNMNYIHASTSIIIIPGYRFRMIDGMITNFHQPGSTLLILISAWIGDKWREIYRYALENGFRFLSYGDSSLLLK